MSGRGDACLSAAGLCATIVCSGRRVARAVDAESCNHRQGPMPPGWTVVAEVPPLLLTSARVWSPRRRGATGETGDDRVVVRRFLCLQRMRIAAHHDRIDKRFKERPLGRV